MARKIYKTIHGITSYSSGLVMADKKTKKYVYFEGGVSHPKFIPSTYSTNDPDIQKALEKSSSFGIKFTLAATIKDRAVKAPTPAKGTDIPKDGEVVAPTPMKAFGNTSIATAITTLIKQGWEGDAEELVDVESVQAAGKALGITFDKLK